AGTPNAELLVQLIGAVVAPVFALASPVAGKLVGRFGVRTVYIVSALLVALGGAGAALCNGLIPILALRVVLAIGVAGGFTAGMSGIARLPEAQRPQILGINAFVAGAICIPLFPLVGLLAAQSWRTAFLAHLVVLVAPLLALGLPRHEAGPAAAGHAAVPATGLLAGLPVALLAITALGGLAMFSSSMYSPFVLGAIGVTEPGRVGQILGVMSLCSLAGSGSYGFVQARLGTPTMLRLGCAVIAAGCLLIGLATALPLAIVGMGLLGAGLAIFATSSYGTAIDMVGPAGNAPAALGVMTFVLYGAQMAFPGLSGTIGKSAGPGAVFLLLSAAMVLSVVLAISLGRPRPAPAPA
ncbi:MAG TPA: MFS transporter, partial [Novosphingobium sp.]